MLNKSRKAIKLINQLSVKILYDSIKPFIEQPPAERKNEQREAADKPADLFSLFTADIINSNILFTR